MSIYLAIYIYLSIYIYFYIHISIRGTCPEEDHGCGSAHALAIGSAQEVGRLGAWLSRIFHPKWWIFFIAAREFGNVPCGNLT